MDIIQNQVKNNETLKVAFLQQFTIRDEVLSNLRTRIFYVIFQAEYERVSALHNKEVRRAFNIDERVNLLSFNLVDLTIFFEKQNWRLYFGAQRKLIASNSEACKLTLEENKLALKEVRRAQRSAYCCTQHSADASFSPSHT